jgi:hypothetical protein
MKMFDIKTPVKKVNKWEKAIKELQILMSK